MPQFIVFGPNELNGEINVKGAKNLALKIIPASLLSEEQITITNVPLIEDVFQAMEVAKSLGAVVKQEGSTFKIQTKEIKTIELDQNLSKKFRASIMFIGPLLARSGEARFPHPGGCVIGAGTRPIDLFLDGYATLGAEISHDGIFYHLKANHLKGAEYFFTTVSVTGTESLMMTAALSQGTTVLKNCAMEPEIPALAKYLNSCGAKINGAGTPTIVIRGVASLRADKINIIPDRIETGTFAIMSALVPGNITITNCNPSHIESLLNVFLKQGINFEKGENWIKVKHNKNIKPYSIKTHEYPGFVTDLQSPFTVLATQAQGRSLIHEVIYDRRLFFTDMLAQMGADIVLCDPHRIIINGQTPLRGRHLISPDIRAGIALVLAALIAQGKTEIDNIYQIERGYEKIHERLRAIGAKIEKINS